MKLAKNFAAAALLVFAISVTSLAGDQQTPGIVPPPPPGSPMMATNPVPEVDINNVTVEPDAAASDAWLYEALTTLLSVY